MDELFVATEHRNIPIDKEIAKKYDIKKGMKTPFTNNLIVDQNGDGMKDASEEKSVEESGGTDESTMLTTSEILDFAGGS